MESFSRLQIQQNPLAVRSHYLLSLQHSLSQLDDYAPTEELLEICEPGTFIHMKDFGLDTNKDLVYLEEISAYESEKAMKDILGSKVVGFDSEFTVCFTKFDRPKLALLQIATNDKVYVFNVLKMKEQSKFDQYQNFVRDLLSNPEILKVGHSIDKDLGMLVGNTNTVIKNTKDIARIYKSLYPEKKKSALTVICQDLLGKPLSKYEQLSKWEDPRLRKAQIFYAGMDALVTLKLFERLKEEVKKSGRMRDLTL